MKHASTGSKWSQSNKRVKFKDDNMLKEINAQIQEKNKRIRRVEFEDEEEEDKNDELVEEKPKETKPAVSVKISGINEPPEVRVHPKFSKIGWF